MMLALDAHYRETEAIFAGVAFHSWQDAEPADTCRFVLPAAAEYEPGAFYKRELPGLLHVLAETGYRWDAIIIDGFVVLDDAGKPGLGMYLYEALPEPVPVIGVAKTRFAGLSRQVAEVFRGESRNPLLVTAVGTDLVQAAEHVRAMHGEHRIPTLLKRVDQLTKME